MQDFINHPLVASIYSFIKSHSLLWFFLLLIFILLFVFNWIADLIPRLDILRSKILLPIAKRYKHKKLTKTAIRSDIKGHVNNELSKMRDYLPQGWIQEVDVAWVECEEPETLKEENKIVVRVRPVDNQDRNFVNATYHYLKSSFFPKAQAVIPKPHFEASVLYVCDKIVENRSDSTKEVFEDSIMEPMIQRHSQIPNHLDSYKKLDKRGFFTGTFLRELHLMATSARFNANRNKMTEETSAMIKHVQDFIKAYDSYNNGEEESDPSAWYYNGPISKYAILLVANPSKTKNGIDAYINRARDRFQSGTERLYVFGSNNESRFAKAVIAGIKGTIDNVKLVEEFDTPHDYRGDPHGVGAVFELSS